MPAVSVIIPTFNRRGLVQQAIDSVLAQDFDDCELIVVDDGSTDDTAEALAVYGPRIRVLRQPNRGVSAARNAGIRAAAAPLIALLDSDDLWLPAKLARQTAFFQAHPGILICQTEEIWVRNGVRVNPRKKHRKPSGMIFERSLELCLVSPSAVMMHQSLLEAVGLFDEALPACEDYDLWLRVACRYPVYLIDDPLIVKRGGHADQLSSRPGLDRYRIRSMATLLESGWLDPAQAAATRQVLQRKCAIYVQGCLKRGKSDEARTYREIAEKYASG
jgi:glycosyltransferase involved in cell wall biosynthesis